MRIHTTWAPTFLGPCLTGALGEPKTPRRTGPKCSMGKTKVVEHIQKIRMVSVPQPPPTAPRPTSLPNRCPPYRGTSGRTLMNPLRTPHLVCPGQSKQQQSLQMNTPTTDGSNPYTGVSLQTCTFVIYTGGLSIHPAVYAVYAISLPDTRGPTAH